MQCYQKSKLEFNNNFLELMAISVNENDIVRKSHFDNPMVRSSSSKVIYIKLVSNTYKSFLKITATQNNFLKITVRCIDTKMPHSTTLPKFKLFIGCISRMATSVVPKK